MHLVEIKYNCRDDLGYGVEEGRGLAYITDEVDAWGKRTILIDKSRCESFERIYLFDDEYKILQEYRLTPA